MNETLSAIQPSVIPWSLCRIQDGVHGLGDIRKYLFFFHLGGIKCENNASLFLPLAMADAGSLSSRC